MPMMTIKP